MPESPCNGCTRNCHNNTCREFERYFCEEWDSMCERIALIRGRDIWEMRDAAAKRQREYLENLKEESEDDG